MNDVIPDQRGICQHCGMWAYWDGRRWRHELSKLAACPTDLRESAEPTTGDDYDTTLPDLAGVRLADLDTTPIDPAAVAALVDKACTPGASISGYNPQRMEDA